MSRTSIFLLRGLITLTSLFAVLILFEYYLRREVSYVVQKGLKNSGGVVQQDPEFLVQYTGRGRRFVPHTEVTIYNHFISGLDVDVSINSLGFRDAEIPLAKPTGEKRIVVLGDSITAGDYLPAEEVYVERMEQQLKPKFPAGIQVINTGIGNIGLIEELNILEDSALKLDPDVVIVAYYLNDTRPPWGFAGEIGDRGWFRRHSLLAETIYRNLMEYRWREEQGEKRFGWITLRDKIDWRTSSDDFAKLVTAARYDWGAAWQGDVEPLVSEQFQRLQKLSMEGGFRVLVAVFPVSYQVYADSPHDEPQRIIERLAQKTGSYSLICCLYFELTTQIPICFTISVTLKRKQMNSWVERWQM